MVFDALTTACMAAELRHRLIPGRVQTLLLVDEHSLGLEVYANGARHQLLLAVPPNAGRVLLVEQKLRRGVEGETPLLLLARKYLRDGVLETVLQPDPTERVLHLGFRHKLHGPSTLVVELIGRRPNLILLRPDGRILECLHRHPPSEAGERVLLPGRPYAPPPAQAKLPPLDDGRPDYYERLAAVLLSPDKLAKVLVAEVAGLSPAAAREAAWRATGDAETSAAATNVLALASALQSMWSAVQTGEWQPGFVRKGGQVIGFAPYLAHAEGEFVPTADLSEALAMWSTAKVLAPASAPAPTPAPRDAYAAQRAEAANYLRRARSGVQRRLAAMSGDEPQAGEAARLRTSAEWLLALGSQIAPGQQQLEVQLEDETLIVLVDVVLGPVEQAQRLFRRAAKLERAAVFIPQRRAELQQDLALIDQLVLDLERATNQPEIAAVRAELAAAQLIAAPKGGGKLTAAGQSGGVLRLRSPQGMEIIVGRNARQNERVTFAEAHPEDLWLHARGVPGSHVVIRSGGRMPDAATIHLAAQWAAYHSAARAAAAVNVTVTRKRWVTRAPGGKLGQVLVKQEEQVVTVPGDLPSTPLPPA